jgi:hypothetical protein
MIDQLFQIATFGRYLLLRTISFKGTVYLMLLYDTMNKNERSILTYNRIQSLL